MTQHKHTPEDFKVHEGDDYIHVYSEKMELKGSGLIANVYEIKHANLIAEAFNVTHETGLTPRQLAEQNKKLIEALEGVIRVADRNTTEFNFAHEVIAKTKGGAADV